MSYRHNFLVFFFFALQGMDQVCVINFFTVLNRCFSNFVATLIVDIMKIFM